MEACRHLRKVFRPGTALPVFLALVIALTLAFGGRPPAVQAAAFTVDTTADSVDANLGDGTCADAGGFCSLRAAIMESNHLSGAQTITLPAGTYTLSLGPGDDDNVDGAVEASGDLDILAALGEAGHSLTINGAGSASTVIQAGTTSSNGIDRLFDVDPPFGGSALHVTLSGVTLRYGRPFVAAPPNSAGGSGGAIRFNGFNNLTGGAAGTNGVLTLSNCILTDNTATDGPGGAIDFNYGNLSLTNVTVQNNTAANTYGNGGAGGGISFVGEALTVSGGSFSGNATINTTYGNGGGLYVNAAAASALGNSGNPTAFTSNHASRDGGGLYVQGTATLTLDSSGVNNNLADNDGGGIAMQSGTLALTAASLSGNTATANPAGSAIVNHASLNLILANTIGGNFDQQAGTVSGGAADQTISGNLNLAGGTFNSTSGLLHLGGDFIMGVGATFNSASGTLDFNSGGTQNLTLNNTTTFATLNVSAGTTLVETVAADNASVTTVTNSGRIRKTLSGNVNGGLPGVHLTNYAGLTSLQVDRIDQSIPNASTALSTGFYWVLTPTGTGSTDVTLPATPPGGAAIVGANRACYDSGAAGYPFTCADPPSLTFTGVSDALLNATPTSHNWAVGSGAGPTSVDLVSLAARSSDPGPVSPWLVFLGLGSLALLVLLLAWLSLPHTPRRR